MENVTRHGDRHTPFIPALEKQRQEAKEFKASQATQDSIVKQNQTTKQQNNQKTESLEGGLDWLSLLMKKLIHTGVQAMQLHDHLKKGKENP